MTHHTDILAELTALYKSKKEEIHSLHKAGVSGHRIVESLSDLTDQIILNAAPRLSPGLLSQWGGTVVAIGGYGRRELSPASDIDLMFLTPSRVKEAETFASGLLCLLWDLGLKVGHSFRSIDECVKTASQDTIIATSMLEARYLTGDRDLFGLFYETFFSKIVSKNLALLQKVDRDKQNLGPYLSEPNIKTSPGGLRDIHQMKWVALPRYRTNSLAKLYQLGRLTTLEYNGLTEARDFLWRIRNELHFQNTDDQLTVERQEAVAAFMRFESRREFMRHYYMMAETISEVTGSFIRTASPKSQWQRLAARFGKKWVDPNFYLFQEAIVPAVPNLDLFFEEDENLLRLFLVAKEHKKIIHGKVMEILQQWKKNHPVEPPILSKRTGEIFRRLLAQPGGIASTLRTMHQTHFLWRIIPEFSRIYGLVQESRSHFFTTDEHTFRAIEAAEQLSHQTGPIAKIYAEIQRKDILHLALLLHDISKGEGKDHSAYGAKIAEGVARRLGYAEEDSVLLAFLVHQHLLFSEVAFYRDFTNEPILLTFTRAVGRPETLKMLLVLTAADIQAVAPGTFTSWKEELLLKLYDEALVILSGEKRDALNVADIRSRVETESLGKHPQIWLSKVIPSLNPRYLAVTSLDRIKDDLNALFHLLTEKVWVSARYDPNLRTTAYTFYTTDAPGLFSQITGVLAARGLAILSAQVFTHDNRMVVDTFSVEDPHTHGPPPVEWIETISKELKHVLEGSETIEALFLKGRRYPQGATHIDRKIPVQIEIDNESAHAFTIIDIFAPDFPGLLYRIAKTIFDLGLSVHSAKIATRLDQIVDVFYVQGADTGKIIDPERIKKIKSNLAEEIEKAML